MKGLRWVRLLLVLAPLLGCESEPQQSSSECRGDYTPGELRRWRDDVRQAAGSTSDVTGLAVFRSPCYLVGIEAESIRPALDRELKRRGVPLSAVQVQVLRVILD